MKKLTFQMVCEQLKEKSEFADRVDDINVLSGASILMLGLKYSGNNISIFLDALTIKDELVSVSKRILDALLRNRTNECDKRMHLMKWAYSIIYYTAFFDVLDEQIPKRIRDSIALSLKEKKGIFQDGLKKGERSHSFIEEEIILPNVRYGYDDIEDHLKALYGIMAEGLREFVKKLSFWETDSEEVVAEFNKITKKMPEMAVERFSSQYLYLASHFNEFYVFSHFSNEKRKSQKIEKLYENAVSIGCELDKKLDIGLERLSDVIFEIPFRNQEVKVKKIVACLIEKYKRDVKKPIIDFQDDKEKLIYPSIESAFIPQSFKVLQYKTEEQLGREDTWLAKKENRNMDSFWAQYYLSPYSLEHLLLILGEPGSGKSLLTKIICARMSKENNIVIRIPLREVDVEKDIEQIVCEQLQKDGDASELVSTFKWFAECFTFNPITIIFDGYDEVLQTTGRVYRNLLNRLSKFQTNCEERHRPIRIIVTSRKFLIDKAEVPVGTTVMRLLEFDQQQKKKWIEIWNVHNENIFRMANISPFSLPENNANIDDLSKQPLLLLMLAVYDANIEEKTNSLRKEKTLNRTKLYNELLCRFIKRELKKGARGEEIFYEELDNEGQDNMINAEMKRLGIVALGMYNRCRLSLQMTDLLQDLEDMEVEQIIFNSKSRMLNGAELIGGSFFFIHRAESGEGESNKREIAIEFMHKTFYEFLLADFILKNLVKIIDGLNELRHLRIKSNYQNVLNDPEHLGKQYYIALMYTDLCREPEVLNMMAEWSETIIDKYFVGKRSDFDITFKNLLERHTEIICKGVFNPSAGSGDSYNKITKTYLEKCAVYLMNLLMLQGVTSSNRKNMFDVKGWKQISQLCKMNVSEETILKFMGLFDISHEGEFICIKKAESVKDIDSKGRIDKLLDIMSFMKEDIVYSLLILHSNKNTNIEKQKYRSLLVEKNMNIDFELILGALQNHLTYNMVDFCIIDNIEEGCRILNKFKVDKVLVMDWLLYLGNCLEKNREIRNIQKNINRLTSVIMEYYSCHLPVMLQLLKFLKRTYSEKIILENKYLFVENLKNCVPDAPNLFEDFWGLLENILEPYEIKGIIQKISNEFSDILSSSPDSAVKMLKVVCAFGNHIDYVKMLQATENMIKQIWDRSPYLAFELFNIYIIQNPKWIVKDEYSEYIIKKFNNLLYEYPDVTIDTIYLFAKQSYGCVQTIIHDIIREFERILYEEPDVAARLIKLLLQLRMENDLEELAPYIMKRYKAMLYVIPEEIVYILEIFHNNQCEDESIREAIQSVLEQFNYLLSKSIKGAVKLLEISKKIDKDIDIYEKIVMCFDSILYKKMKVDVFTENLLMDLLEVECDEKSLDYFWGKRSYISIYYTHIYERLLKIYENLK